MDFLILGPLEVVAEGRRLPVAGAKQRALLGLLLLHRNRVVSTDRLIEELWGDDPPETGAAALQMRISGLRKALEGRGAREAPSQVLITRAPGYVLRVEQGRLDADRFEAGVRDGRDALAAGDPAAAAAALGEALSLWRGEPLADLAYEPFAQAEIARLAELRLIAAEERMEADLALGRHGERVGELEALVAQHPFRERLHGQLMLALYRSGRQAEALAAYRETSRTLRDELGIEPSPALQRLEVAILRQDPGLELTTAPTIAPAAPPATTPALPGSSDATERRKTVTVLVGEPLIAAVPEPTEPTDPETLRRVGERHLELATSVVERHGGTLERLLGEQFMAVFGVPGVHEDDALRAIRAALELDAALGDIAEELQRTYGARVVERIGIESGEVITGDPAAGRPLVVGEPVARAGRLARAAAPGEILLGGVTRTLAATRVLVERVGDGAHLDDWRLLELASEAPAARGRLETPLVGRATELAQVRVAFERAARDRSVGLCTILGAAGIGKSRLAAEFVSLVEGRATVLTGRCLAYGEGITFWPLNEIVRQAAPDGAIAILLEGEEQADVVAERVAGAIGLTDAPGSVEETSWAVRRLLEAIARTGPLVVVLEDIHWAESTFLALLEYLASWTRESPILLLCLARPELLDLRPAWGRGRPDATTITLGPLADDESEALLDAQPGMSRLAPSIRRRVQETAEGNPFFLEQIVAMVAEQGTPSGDLPVPPTIEAVLAARLERLGPGERAVLERAAVMGKEFWPGAVAELLPDEAQTPLRRHLDALVRKDLLRPVRSRLVGEAAFRFRHVLIQQSAYRSIPKSLRRQLHEAFGDWLEERAGSRLAEVEELVGYHLEQATLGRAEAGPVSGRDRELAQRAAERLAAAGRRAFRRGDMPASVNLLDRAASLLPPEDPVRLDLLSDLAFALFEVGELERSSRVLAEVIERGTAIGDRRAVARGTVKRDHVEFYAHPAEVDQERVLRDAARAITVFRAAGDDAGLARAWTLVSEIRAVGGKAAVAAKAAARAARHAHRAGSRRDEAWSLGTYGFDVIIGPTPVADGVRDLERRLREAAGDPVLGVNLSSCLAPLEAMAGRIAEARERVARSRVVTNELGLRWQTGTHDLWSAVIEMLADDPAAAEAHLRTAVQTFSTTGDMWFLGFVTVERARALCEQGRDGDALEIVERFDALPAETGVTHRIRRNDVAGRLLARRGDHDAALALAREAVAIAERTDFLGFHADALAGLAEVLRLGGGPEDADIALRQAVELHERKGNVVEAAKARGRLASVFPGAVAAGSATVEAVGGACGGRPQRAP